MSLAFQYHEKKSFMHDIDPISKLIWLVCISILVFIYETALPQVYLFSITLLMAVILARLNPLFVLRGIWIMILFGIGFFILQVLLVPGSTVVFSIGPKPIYWESIDFAIAITLRILTIFTSSLIFVTSSDPRDIVLALTQKLKLPYRYAFSVFVALRFIPTLENEAKVIEAAQTIRGVGKKKGLKNMVMNFKRFTMPLLMGAIRRVKVTATMMESKGYGAYSDRSYIRTIDISKKGIVFASVWVCVTIGAIVTKFI